MSLQANWNRILSIAAVYKRIGNKLPKAQEAQTEPTSAPDTEPVSKPAPKPKTQPVANAAEAADRAQEHIQEADTVPNSGAEFRRRLLQRLTKPKNDEDDIINPSLLEGGNN